MAKYRQGRLPETLNLERSGEEKGNVPSELQPTTKKTWPELAGSKTDSVPSTSKTSTVTGAWTNVYEDNYYGGYDDDDDDNDDAITSTTAALCRVGAGNDIPKLYSGNCLCGRDVDWHEQHETLMVKENVDPFPLRGASPMWYSKPLPETTSFGFIKFQGSGKSAPYIRLDPNTGQHLVWELLSECWCMPRPKLVVSVTGGAKNEPLFQDKQKSDLKRGLLKAASSANAWIVTGGTAAGVMEFVGEAVNEHVMATGGSRQNVVLGIAPWGIVNNKETLIGEENTGKFPAHYREGLFKYWTVPLDHNHTHFLLVDDGTQGKYGGELDFRTDLEKFMSDQQKIPVVILMIDGGRNSIRNAMEGAKRNTPVLVVQGSGRAADLIAEAFRAKQKSTECFEEFLNDKMSGEFDTESCKDNIRCLLDDQFKEKISFISLKNGDCINEMRHAILSAVLKANNSDIATQLNLALALDCCDLARSEIFNQKNRRQWQDLDLSIAMMTALEQNKPDFVQLFLDHDADLTDLTESLAASTGGHPSKLEELYHNMINESTDINARLLKQLLPIQSDKHQLLHDVGNVVSSLLGGRHTYNVDMHNGEASYPERELFVWAVLLNRKELALLFWKEGVEHIGAALVASCMLKSLSMQADKMGQLQLSQMLKTNAADFETLAVEVLHACYLQNVDMAHALLVGELETWGKATLLTIASSGKQMEFMGHAACQQKLNMVWHGKMALHTPRWKIFGSMFLPFIIFSIKFSPDKGESSTTKPMDMKTPLLKKGPPGDHDGTPDGSHAGKSQDVIGLCRRIHLYHTAPIVKFAYNMISQMVFVVLFSYFVMCDLHPLSHPNSPSIVEIVVWVWSVTLYAEELRQFMSLEAVSLSSRMTAYLHNKWNIFDLVIYTCFLVSVVLRLTLDGDSFDSWVRTFYSITVALFYVRFIQTFYASRRIGPKVIIIRQMLTDLMFFICILVVFVLGYGVAIQALRYPNAYFGWSTLTDVVYMPYWQMHGNLFLEEIQGDVGQCSFNRTEWELNPDIVRCPEMSRLPMAMLAVYELITKTMLLSVLVAMFSQTFQRVQDNSDKVYRFHRYALIREFVYRPTLAPPLIVFSHIWRLFKYVRRDHAGQDELKVVYDSDESSKMISAERAAAERRYFDMQPTDSDDIGAQIAAAKDRIERVIEDLDEIKDRVSNNYDDHS